MTADEFVLCAKRLLKVTPVRAKTLAKKHKTERYIFCALFCLQLQMSA